jgi:hypothetical protein
MLLQGACMHMTEAFASAVTVSVPIFALAAGAEARGVRERLQRPDRQWERDYAAHAAAHELDLEGRPSQVFDYFKGVPGLSRAYLADRVMAIGAALVWLAVFVLLGITELLCLAWLADGGPPGGSGLATFALVAIGAAMAALIVAPTLYLLVPLRLPLDVIPQGLKDTLGARLSNERGRGFVRLAFQELEGAMERATDKLEAAGKREAAGPQPGAEAGPTATAAAASVDMTLADNDRQGSGRAGHHDPDDHP